MAGRLEAACEGASVRLKKPAVRRTTWRLATLAMVWLASVGCGQIACPNERVADGDACKCPDGKQVDSTGTCREVKTDPDEDAGHDVAGETRDAGARDAAIIVQADGGSGPVPSSDAGPRDQPTVDAGPNMSGGPGANPPNTLGMGGADTGPTSSGGGESCDDGNDDPYDACVGHKRNVCGDGALYIGHEECEVGAPNWTKENCVNCRRQRYETCERLDDCWAHKTQYPDGTLGPDICIDGVCAPFGCDNGELCQIPCPRIGDYDVTLRGGHCLIGCVGDASCPPGLTCEGLPGADFKHCVVHGYTPGYTHYP